MIGNPVKLSDLVSRLYKGKKHHFILMRDGKMIANLSDDMIIKRYFSAEK
ncbi:hypothetical protein JMA_23340 [Jeotgalibacillus malaysiensis]|uniref:Uncharacterized protein n=1 Tax=Jeotgalibacillus malaysiensis TaxID=1508404 RepID=A0A0B5ANC9_9BACL|nr:hypothetical protein JMA_23340 [Jeotgalibacillus malaysiensis]